MTRKDYAYLVKDRLLAEINPRAVILFGSVARGVDHDDSDLDLLIVWDEKPDLSHFRRRIYLRKVIGLVDIPVDLLTCTSSELSQAILDEASFTARILKEGEIIYGGLD